MNTQSFDNVMKEIEEISPGFIRDVERRATEIQEINQLINIRRMAGLSQEEVATRMGTDKGNISKLENNRYNPSIKNLRYYADACGYSLSLMFKPKSNKPPEEKETAVFPSINPQKL